MVETEVQEQKIVPIVNAWAENNFDILQKTYPDQKDKIDFLNNEKFKDIKEPLATTIHSLAKENIVSSEDFWNNIQQVVETIFSDPLYEIDSQQKEIDAKRIFLFRTEFENIKKETNKNIKEETTSKKEETTSKKEETTSKKEEKTEEKNTTLKIEIETNETSREKLDKTYETIEPQYKHKKQDEFNTFKNQEKFQDIINKFKTEEKINKYFKHRFAAEKIAEEAREKNIISKEYVSFITQFNQLDQELNLNSQIDISDIPKR